MGAEFNRNMKQFALRRERIQTQYDAGDSLTNIAKRHKITPARVHQIINRKAAKHGRG